MCNENEIFTLVQLAQKEEKVNPKDSAKNYLLAAQSLVEASTHHPEKESQYLELAQKSYLKAKQLQEKTQLNKFVPPNKNKITFEHIGGLTKLKEGIKLKIIEPFKHPELFKYYGKQAGGGILMYGPPGCGKSLIAKATANEAGVSFIHVKSSDLKSKYVGETEKNIAELFAQARESQPTVIFFDEFDSLGSDRSDAPAHDKSAVAQLLTEMDGMDSKEQQILLLAATNEPWSIDPALRREGRFGTTLFIPPPDEEARRDILQINLAHRPTEEINFDELAKLTVGFSGADLKAVCELATEIPLKESLHTGKRRKISKDDLRKAIKGTHSILKPWFSKALQQVQKRHLEEDFMDLVQEARKTGKMEA